MNIQHKFLIAFFCFFVGSTGISSATSPVNPLVLSTEKKIIETPPCDFPAPANFHFTEIRTNALYIAWDPSTNAPFEYNIKVTENSSGNVVYNQNIAGIWTAWRVPGLQPNTEYTVRNTPVCYDGTLSFNYVEGVATTLIVDLVVNSFTIPSGSSSCTINANDQFCYAAPLPGNIVRFKIRPTGSETQGRVFGVFKVAGCTATTVMVRPEDDSNSSYRLYCNNGIPGGDSSPDCSGPVVTIKLNGSLVATFGFGTAPGGTQALVWVGSNPQSHEIIRLNSPTGDWLKGNEYNDCSTGGNAFRSVPSEDRDEDTWINIPSAETLTAIPNPFTNQLEVQIPFANINENTELSLYDLQGRRMMVQITPGDQQSITLTTENLTPGMYFLRAESGGMIQTVKVVKTQ